MKNLFLIASVLMLAACGGGSGGGGGGSSSGGRTLAPLDLTLPDGVRETVSSEVAESNSHVTSLKSSILVASSGGRTQFVRSASSPLTNDSGVTFISYDLEDVKLRPADYDVPDNAYLKIGLDANGQVDEMTIVMGELNGQEVGGAVARAENSTAGNARFNGPIFEYVKDKYAKVNGSEFYMANNEEAMRNAIATAMNFNTIVEGSGWKMVGGAWKCDTEGAHHFAVWCPDGQNEVEYSVGATTADMETAIKNIYNFRDGKWETDTSGNLKYREYGNDALYRMAAADSVTMGDLNEIAEDLPMGHWNRIDETMEVVSLGGGAGLQYSDFGHFNPVYSEKKININGKDGNNWLVDPATLGDSVKTNTGEEMEEEFAGKDYQLFAGGYAVSGTDLLPTLNTPRNSTFTGNAIGRVYVSFEGNGEDKSDELAYWNVTSGDGHDIAMDFTTTNAQLTVNANGKETLSMPFEDFYTVTVERNGNTVNYAFTGTPDD